MYDAGSPSILQYAVECVEELNSTYIQERNVHAPADLDGPGSSFLRSLCSCMSLSFSPTLSTPPGAHYVREEQDGREHDANACEENVRPARPQPVEYDLYDGDKCCTKGTPYKIIL